MADTSRDIGGGGGGEKGECQGPRKMYMSVPYGRAIRSMLPQENFEKYNPWNVLSSILGTVFYRIPKVVKYVKDIIDFLVDYFRS